MIGPLASEPLDKEYDGSMSPPDLNGKAAVSGKGSRVITGLDLIRRQFLALFIKRFHYARRSRKGLVAQVIASVCQADEGPSSREDQSRLL